jgi:hypothetical protein
MATTTTKKSGTIYKCQAITTKETLEQHQTAIRPNFHHNPRKHSLEETQQNQRAPSSQTNSNPPEPRQDQLKIL